jgi:hypothetical protein
MMINDLIKIVTDITEPMSELCHKNVALEDQRSMNSLQCNSMRV